MDLVGASGVLPYIDSSLEECSDEDVTVLSEFSDYPLHNQSLLDKLLYQKTSKVRNTY